MSTIAIILATDPGEGFTSSKFAMPVNGQPMLRAAVESALTWNVDGVVVVLGPDAETNADLIDDVAVTTVIDPEWDEGVASPLRVALDLVTRDKSVEHTIVSCAEQPGISAEVADKLIQHAVDAHVDAVVPKYRYQRGWPVVVGSSLWRRMLGMEGSYDMQGLISMHADTIEEVWFDRLAPSVYVTPEDMPTH